MAEIISKIELIISDIDGCLGGKRFELRPLELIRQHCEQIQDNINLPPFAFATGRGGEYVDCLARMLNAFTPGNIPSIVENGSFLFKPEGRIYIPHPKLKGKEKLIMEARASIKGLIKNGRARLIQGKEACLSLKPVDEEITTNQLEKDVRSLLEPFFLEQFFVTHSTTAVDITVRGVDKGTCLDFLCEQIGIRPDKILAIGDTAGDLPILQRVGFPACPGNASDEVKNLVLEKNGYVAQAEFAWGVIEIMKHYEIMKEE